MAKKVNELDIIAGIKWDATSIDKMLTLLGKTTKRMEQLKASTAAACVMHAIEHGNATPMTRFLKEVGEGERNDAIVKWAMEFGPFKWDRDADLKMNVFKMDTDKATTLKEKGASYLKTLIDTPYWTYVPQREVPAFNSITALKTFLGRAHKAMKDEAVKAKSDFTLVPEVEALLAKLSPAKAAA